MAKPAGGRAVRERLQGLHLHFDPVSGIAGDMTVAALVDAGVPPAVVTRAVAAMGVRGLRVSFEARKRGAFMGRGFVVKAPAPHHHEDPDPGHGPAHGQHEHEHGHHHAHEGHDHAHRHDHDHGPHRDYREVKRLLRAAGLDKPARRLAEEIFARLAEVEGALHGVAVERVTFHEVGAYDSIADVVGAAAAIAWLAPASIGSSPPVLGTGMVRTAHGPVPVPAPATAALLAGIPVLAEGVGELTTPTGAAILVSAADAFGPPPPLRLTAVGYGAGSRELTDRANVLRVMLGETLGAPLPASASASHLLEANIDDMSPQLLAPLFEALFAAGALDVWATPILMKKGRPAQQLSALVEPGDRAAVERAFFLNSTTLGIRARAVERATLPRALATVRTAYGPLRVKVAGLDGEAIGAQPEFEDCKRLAAVAGVPIKRVWQAALAAAAALVPPPRAALASAPRGRRGGRSRR